MAIAEKMTKERGASDKAKSSAKIDENPANYSKPFDSVLRLHHTIGNKALQGLFEAGFIQAKLTIGQPNDIYEQEADRVADEVMRMPDPELKPQPALEGENDLHRPKLGDIPQALSKVGLVVREETDQIPSVTEKSSSQVSAIKGGGSPLSKSEKDYFEPRFGRDFSEVRIHSDSQANELAQSVNAQAFTNGHDVVFQSGRYAPTTDSGTRLLAHELTHVVQQSGGSYTTAEGRMTTYATESVLKITPQNLLWKKRTPIPISSLTGAAIQCFRDGRVGTAHYNESPRDVIAIRMPYNIEDLDTILTNINRIVQQFGSSSRTYTNDINFQLMLRSFLQEIGHPSVSGGGPMMTRQRWLRLRIGLVREEGRRISRLQLLRPREEVTVETPEIIEPRQASEPRSATEANQPVLAGERRVPAEQEGILGRIASGAEALGDLASGRWVWDPITSQMTEWEAELDRVGEQGAPTTLGSVLLVPVALLFVILQAIVGALDLLARLNPFSLALRGSATGVRAGAGQYTREDFLRDATEVGDQALDIITLGLRNAYRHLQEGLEEANAFRITQAVGEIVLAALAIFGVFRAIRARSSTGRMAAAVAEESAVPTPARPSAPTEPTNLNEPVRPSAPTEPAPEVRIPGRRSSWGRELGLRVERVFNTLESARQVRDAYVSRQVRGGYIEALREQSFVDHWVETGGRGQPPLAFIDNHGTLVFNSARIGRAPSDVFSAGARRTAEAARSRAASSPRVQAAIVDVGIAREMMENFAQRGQIVIERSARQMQRSWESAGGEGTAPAAFINEAGDLLVNKQAVTGQ